MSSLLSESEGVRNVNYLASLDFIISLGFGLIIPMFPIYAEELGAGGLEIGILFSSFVLTRALLSASFGNLSDRIGRKRLILAGSFLYSLLAVLFTVPDTWYGLIFVRALQGVASAMVWPVSAALVIDSASLERRGESMGKIVMASNLGFVVGPFVGGALFYLADKQLGFPTVESLKFPFYFTAVIALAGALLVWARVTDAVAPRGVRQAFRLRDLFSPAGMDWEGIRNLRILYTNAVMEGLAFASLVPVMVLFLEYRFGLDVDVISVLIGTAMGFGALVALPAGKRSDRVGRKSTFVLGGFIAFVGTMLVPFALTLWAVLIFLVMRSMAFQVASPALRALQADIVPEAVRGRLMGMMESMMNVGSVVGAVLGGLLWDQFHEQSLGLPSPLGGTIVPFVVSGLLGISAVSLVLIYVKETRPGISTRKA
jgi:DHA1 family multidrug resistance protein-like MFS transporter